MEVKEVDLVSEGNKMTPITHIASVYMTDGRKLIDVLNDVLKNIDGTVIS